MYCFVWRLNEGITGSTTQRGIGACRSLPCTYMHTDGHVNELSPSYNTRAKSIQGLVAVYNIRRSYPSDRGCSTRISCAQSSHMIVYIQQVVIILLSWRQLCHGKNWQGGGDRAASKLCCSHAALAKLATIERPVSSYGGIQLLFPSSLHHACCMLASRVYAFIVMRSSKEETRNMAYASS